jgi:hypothetical protein
MQECLIGENVDNILFSNECFLFSFLFHFFFLIFNFIRSSRSSRSSPSFFFGFPVVHSFLLI